MEVEDCLRIQVDVLFSVKPAIALDPEKTAFVKTIDDDEVKIPRHNGPPDFFVGAEGKTLGWISLKQRPNGTTIYRVLMASVEVGKCSWIYR